MLHLVSWRAWGKEEKRKGKEEQADSKEGEGDDRSKVIPVMNSLINAFFQICFCCYEAYLAWRAERERIRLAHGRDKEWCLSTHHLHPCVLVTTLFVEC